jgi:hypothetical protein
MIFGILRQVAVRARVGDLLDDAGPLNLQAVLELVFKRRVAGGRHWNFFHRFFSSWRTPEPILSNQQRRQAPFSPESGSIDS